MSREMVEEAKKRLEPEDRIQKSYAARHNGVSGYFLMSKKRLLFIEEKGFLQKRYYLILDVPYEKITGITAEDSRELTIVEVGDKKHSFTSFDISSLLVEADIKNLIGGTMITA
ncbi:MAG: hypothetical protein QG670_1262 [Thermoproteota archaeon]|nr:hypothetical protein [Thermoproteota archaeon]